MNRKQKRYDIDLRAGLPDHLAQKLRAKGAEPGTKILEAPARKAYVPTDEEKSKVLGMMTGIENLEGFGFYETVAAQTKLDRQNDVLSKNLLAVMASHYSSGRAMVDSHEHTQRIGRTFAAEVVESDEAGVSDLRVKFYVPPFARMMSGNLAKEEIDSGIVDRVSVSFYTPVLRYLESDAEGNELGVDHFVYDVPSDPSQVETFELSTVTMGAQQGAHIKTRGAQNARTKETDTLPSKESEMELVTKKLNIRGKEFALELPEEKAAGLDAVEAEIKAMSEKLEAFEAAEATELDALVSQVVAKKKQFGPDPEKFDAEAETAKLKKFSKAELQNELSYFSAMKPKQLEPKRKEKETDEENPASPFAGY